jgi:hypothetical protein
VRLAKVHSGHALKQKLMLLMIRVFGRRSPPGVIRTLLYRPDFFGKRMSALTQKIMRGPSPWSVGERELFAAFVSRLNQCLF